GMDTAGDGSLTAFFFSSRRRHTIFSRDWSSDVCSSDLAIFDRLLGGGATFTDRHGASRPLTSGDLLVVAPFNAQVDRIQRALREIGRASCRERWYGAAGGRVMVSRKVESTY